MRVLFSLPHSHAQLRAAHGFREVAESWREECVSPDCQLLLVGCCPCSSQNTSRLDGAPMRAAECGWSRVRGCPLMKGFGANGVNAPTGALSKGYPARPKDSRKNLTLAPTFKRVTSGRLLTPFFVLQRPDRRVGRRPPSRGRWRVLAAAPSRARLPVSVSGSP